MRLMAPRAITSPRGSANSRVRANSLRVVPRPSSKVRVTVSSIDGSSHTGGPAQRERRAGPGPAVLLLDDGLLDAVGGGHFHHGAVVVGLLPEGVEGVHQVRPFAEAHAVLLAVELDGVGQVGVAGALADHGAGHQQ